MPLNHLDRPETTFVSVERECEMARSGFETAHLDFVKPPWLVRTPARTRAVNEHIQVLRGLFLQRLGAGSQTLGKSSLCRIWLALTIVYEDCDAASDCAPTGLRSTLKLKRHVSPSSKCNAN